MRIPLPYAHLGHWYFQLAFSVPALAVIGYMARDALRRRWRQRRERGPAGGQESPADQDR